MEDRINGYRILVKQSEGKVPHVALTCSWEGNIKADLKGKRERVNLIQLV